MQYRKKCIICGKEFDSLKAHTKTCSEECRHTKNILRRLNYNKARATKEQVKKPKKKESLVDIAVAAKKAGMTYGQYVAQSYLRKEKD